jgi:hypothetical protein
MAQPRQLPDPIREWLRALVERDGIPAAGRALGLADATIARAAGGLVVQSGTIALIEAAYRTASEAA